MVTEGYFRAMGIPLLAGRAFTTEDIGAAGPFPAVINQRMAEILWPDEHAVGKSFSLSSPHRWTVVGVVANVPQFGAERRAIAEAYLTCSAAPENIIFSMRSVRYLVVGDIDAQAAARLVSPLAVDRVGDEPQQIFLSLDRDRVLEAPDVGQELPVSLQAEMVYHDYYGWSYYWQEGPYARGAWPAPPSPLPPDVAMPPSAGDRTDGGEEAEGCAQEGMGTS